MKGTDPRLRALAYQILKQELDRGESGATDATLEREYQRLYDALVGLVGEVGFQALLLRAAHLAGPELGWLAKVLGSASANVPARELAELARGQQVALTFDCMTTLFAHLIGLLFTFIGDDLTMRLVRRTWTGISAPDSGLTEDQ